MLQKNRSKRIALAKYGLSVPLFVVMLILSSATVNNCKALKNISTKAEDVLLVPASSSVAMLADDNKVEVARPVLLADTEYKAAIFCGRKICIGCIHGKKCKISDKG